LHKKPKEVAKNRYTLGDEVSLPSCAREADSIVLIEAKATTQTGGRKTISLLAGGIWGVLLTMSTYNISIAFADAKTGEIEAFVSSTTLGGKAGKDPDEALRMDLVAQLKAIHFGSPAP
jgi:hypothetical protein